MQRAFETPIAAAEQTVGPVRRQKDRIEPKLTGNFEPGDMRLQFVVCLGKIGGPARAVADVLAQLGRDASPQPGAFDHQGQFARVAPHLADPAPIA
jgi:hypothetical protein